MGKFNPPQKPEYDPDYVKLANGRVIKMDRATYEESLENSPAVTGVTYSRLETTMAVTSLSPKTIREHQEIKKIRQRTRMLLFLVPTASVFTILLGFLMARMG